MDLSPTGDTEFFHEYLMNLKTINEFKLIDYFFWTIEKNNVAELNRLLENGFNPNTQNKYGETVLIAASFFGNYDLMETLLKYGADPNLLDIDGFDPLRFEVWKVVPGGSLKNIQLLIDWGADISSDLIEMAKEDKNMKLTLEFYQFISNNILSYQNERIIHNPQPFKPAYREMFNKFISRWTEYAAKPYIKMYPKYLKFIAKLIGIPVFEDDKIEEIYYKMIIKLDSHLDKIENLDYELFKDFDPVTLCEFSEFDRIDLYQYGDPIEGKYRGITEDYINHCIDKTIIKDPFDRSDLMNKKSNLIDGNVYQDYLLRKMNKTRPSKSSWSCGKIYQAVSKIIRNPKHKNKPEISVKIIDFRHINE